MATLITDQITSTTIASRPRLTMPISAALEMIMRSELISASSTTAIDRAVELESREPDSVRACGNVDSTKGALGMYAVQGAFSTRLGSRRPPSPPV